MRSRFLTETASKRLTIPANIRRLALIALVALMTVAAAPAVHAATVTLTASSLTAYASHSAAGYDNQTVSPTSLPTAGEVGAAIAVSVATTVYELSEAGFDLRFSGSAGAIESATARNNGNISFIPSTDIGYVLYTSKSGDGSMSVQLSDMTSNTQLTSSTGVLAANHVYQLSYSRVVHASYVLYGRYDASGSGNLNLIFQALIDSDDDGVSDAVDNCPLVSNEQQEDQDGDTVGDACDSFPADPDNEKAQCFVDLDESNAALAQAQEDLAACQAQPSFQDADGDGMADQTDRCPGTPVLTPVDDSGCSRAQFCVVRVATCKGNDWLNDEPASKHPGDCVSNKRAGTCN